MLVVLAGCSNLAHKAFSAGGSVEAFKLVLGVDPESGNPLPFPQQVILGFGTYWILDMPMTEGAEAFYYSEDPARFSSGLSRTLVYFKSGNGELKGFVKVKIDSKTLIDFPIFKIYDPFSAEKEVKVEFSEPEEDKENKE
jgi:hypothetical protein